MKDRAALGIIEAAEADGRCVFSLSYLFSLRASPVFCTRSGLVIRKCEDEEEEKKKFPTSIAILPFLFFFFTALLNVQTDDMTQA